MKNIQRATKDNEKQILFGVSLNWLSKQVGILYADDAAGTICVATPSVFGGEGRDWSPEHLLLGAVNGCFMSTYLVFAKKFKFDVSRFECNVTGKIQLVEGKYQFTQIDVFSKVFVAEESLKEKADLALQKTRQYCLISNSIKAEITYHGEVIVDSHRIGHNYEL